MVSQFSESCAVTRSADAFSPATRRSVARSRRSLESNGPPQAVAGMRKEPFWARVEALAHTLAHDARVLGDYRIPADRANNLTVPTLVIAGAAMPFMRDTAAALAEILPQG